MTIRRVVVANTNGTSCVVEEGKPPRSAEFTAPEGLAQSLVWRTEPVPSLDYDGTEPTTAARSVLPQPGGTSLIALTIPPDSAYADPSFDPVAAAAESAQHTSPGWPNCSNRTTRACTPRRPSITTSCSRVNCG